MQSSQGPLNIEHERRQGADEKQQAQDEKDRHEHADIQTPPTVSGN